MQTSAPIFALGTVIYEMVTGKPPFAGQSRAILIAAILASEPVSIKTLKAITPPALDRVVGACLAKDADERWQRAHDLKMELSWIANAGSGEEHSAAPSRFKRERLAGAGVVIALLIVLIAAVYGHRSVVPPPMLRFVIQAPEGYTLNDAHTLAISTDGRKLVLLARDAEDKTSLWLRSLDSVSAHQLPGTEGSDIPVWSLYQINSAILSKLVVRDSKGTPLSIINTGLWLGAMRVAPGGRLLFSKHNPQTHTSDLWMFDLQKNDWQRLTFDKSTGSHIGVPSSDGKQVVYASVDKAAFQLHRKALGGAEVELLANNDLDQVPSDWSPDGRFLLFTQTDTKGAGDLWAMPMNTKFSQIQKDIEAVWAVEILLQSREVIDHLMQCHSPHALGSDGSLIGIDFVSYSHGSILPAGGCRSFASALLGIACGHCSCAIKQAQLIVAFGPLTLAWPARRYDVPSMNNRVASRTRT
jgi:hypothetical protein